MKDVGNRSAGTDLYALAARAAKEKRPTVVELDDGSRVIVAPLPRSIDQDDKSDAAVALMATLIGETQGDPNLGHWIWDEIEDCCIYCSAPLAGMLGITVEEYIEQSRHPQGFAPWVHPEDQDRYVETIKGLKAAPATLVYEYRLRVPNGRDVHLREVIAPQIDAGGRMLSTVGFTQNITDQKVAEQGLARTQQELTHAQNLAKLGSWRWDAVTQTLVSCSDECARIYGVDPANAVVMLNNAIESLIHPDDRFRVAQMYEVYNRELGAYELEYRIVRPDGLIRDVREIGEPVVDTHGRVIEVIGTIQDITERKAHLVEMERREILLSQAMRAAHMGTWIWDDTTDECVYCSEELAVIFGETVEDYLYKHTDGRNVFTRLHPDDRESYETIIRESDRGRTGYSVEFREITADGSYKYFREFGHPTTFSPDGHQYSVGIVQDLTELRTAESELRRAKADLEKRVEDRTRELRESEERFRTLFQNAASGIGRTSLADGTVLAANTKLATIFGYDDVARFAAEFRFSEHYLDDGSREWLLNQHDLYPDKVHEMTFTRRDGSPVHLEGEISVNYDEGTIDFVVIDVSRRHEIQRSLARAEQEYKSLFDNALVGIGRNRHADGKVLLANQTLAEMFGYATPEEMIADYDFAQGCVRPQERENLLAALRSGESRAIEQTFRRRDGTLVTTLGYHRPGTSDEWFDYVAIDITEMKAASQEKERLEDVVRALIENSPIPISVKDPDGTYKHVSPAYARYLEMLPENVIGHRASVMLAPRAVEAIDAADRRVLESGEPLSAEESILVHFGHAALSLSKFPVKDADGKVTGICTVGMDVSELNRSNDELREQRNLLEQAEEIALLGHWRWTADGETMLSCSSQAAAIFGMTREQLLEAAQTHRQYLDLIHYEDREYVDRSIAELCHPEEGQTSSSGAMEIEYRIQRPDGSISYILDRARILTGISGDAQIVGTIQDITQHKVSERQLIEAGKLASLGEMATGIAHELNQPLNVIRMSADSLTDMMEEEGVTTETLRTHLDRISEQMNRAVSIINHMRTFGRATENESFPFDVLQVVDNAVDFLGEQMRLHDIGIDVEKNTVNRQVFGHPIQLEQVIVNIISNARDAIDDWDGRDAARHIWIVVEDGPGFGEISIIVRDTGPGIAPEVASRLFDPFFTTKEIGKGTGIGLSISYGIVQNMKGRIEARNWKDGAEFVVTLPVYTDAEA